MSTTAPTAPTAPKVTAPAAPVSPAAPAAPKTVSAPAAPVAAPAVDMVDTTVAEKKASKPRNEKQITPEDIEFIKANVRTMGYKEIADARSLSTHQVNQVLQKIRQGMRDAAIARDGEGAYARALDESGQPKVSKNKNSEGAPIYDYSQPLTEMAKKVEEKIASALSRPDSVGRKGGGSATAGTYASSVDEFLADL